jgi:hypothetical protein
VDEPVTDPTASSDPRTPEPCRFEVAYTPELCKAASRFHLRQFVDWKLLLAYAILIGLAALEAYYRGLSTLVLCVLFLVGFSVFFYPMLYRAYVRRSLAFLERMKDPTVSFELDESAFRSRSSLGKSELKWEAFTHYRVSPKVWALYTARFDFISFPAETLDQEARELIQRKIQKKK